MYVIYPRLKRAERYKLGPDMPAEWRDAMSLLEAGFPRDRHSLESQFKVTGLIQTNTVWELALQPRAAFARKIMPELLLGLATNNFSLVSTEVLFADGSRLRNDFSASSVNASFETNLFEWTPPTDFKVTDPLAR